MNRKDFITEVQLDNGEYRKDYHSAVYAGLTSVTFPTTMYTVSEDEKGRPDLVANAVYGDPFLWFPLYQYNKIINPVTETIPGLILKVPSAAQLDQYLKALLVVDTTGEVVQI